MDLESKWDAFFTQSANAVEQWGELSCSAHGKTIGLKADADDDTCCPVCTRLHLLIWKVGRHPKKAAGYFQGADHQRLIHAHEIARALWGALAEAGINGTPKKLAGLLLETLSPPLTGSLDDSDV